MAVLPNQAKTALQLQASWWRPGRDHLAKNLKVMEKAEALRDSDHGAPSDSVRR
jgi:hypothetical protein